MSLYGTEWRERGNGLWVKMSHKIENGPQKEKKGKNQKEKKNMVKDKRRDTVYLCRKFVRKVFSHLIHVNA